MHGLSARKDALCSPSPTCRRLTGMESEPGGSPHPCQLPPDPHKVQNWADVDPIEVSGSRLPRPQTKW